MKNATVRRFSSSSKMRLVSALLLSVILLVELLAAASPAVAQSPAPAKFTTASLVDTGYEGLTHGGNVDAIAGGDFNGDGKPDLVAVGNCTCTQAVEILLNNGDGTFSVSQSSSLTFRGNGDGIAQHTPNILAVADFNGDGKLDFAVYINGASTSYVDVYLGDGTGHFSFSNSYSVGGQGQAYPYGVGVTVADVNGDGKPDLLATNAGDNTLTVLLGNGDGTFQTGALYPACNRNGCEPLALTTADLNKDGHPDVVIVSADAALQSGVYVLLNNGNGTFAAPVFYSSSGGAFSDSESGVATADLNGDGNLDIVMTNNNGVSAFLGNGDGTLQTAVNYGVPTANSIAIVDLNKDNKLDLVVSDLFNNSVWVLMGNGNGTFKPGVAYATDWFAQSLVVADLNHDGNLDFAVGSDTSPMVTLALGNGDGTFRTGPNYDIGNWTGQVAADFNNDGNLDVAVYTTNLIQVMAGSSHGILSAPLVSIPTQNLVALQAGDVNGDGIPDLVGVVGGSVPQIKVFLGIGNGKFRPALSYPTGNTNANPAFLLLTDLNHDGRPDVVVSNQDGSLSVLLNKANAQATVIPNVSQQGAWVVAGDFNGDGKMDVVVQDYGNNSLNLLLGNGNGTFQAPIYISVDRGPAWLTAADVNKDGKMDLITGGYGVGSSEFNGGGMAVYLGNGNGTFSAPTYYSFFPNSQTDVNPTMSIVADVNHDGTPDLLVAFANTHVSFQCCFAPDNAGLAIFLGNGDGTFSFENSLGEPGVPGGPFLIGTGDYALSAGDFNGDGATDVAVLNQYNFGGGSGQAYVTMLLNRTLPVSVSPLNMTFTPTSVGSTSSPQTVLVTNDQSTSLGISKVVLGGTDPADFQFLSKCGRGLLSGNDCSIYVDFKPTATGTRTANLSITDSVGTQVVSLTGTGK